MLALRKTSTTIMPSVSSTELRKLRGVAAFSSYPKLSITKTLMGIVSKSNSTGSSSGIQKIVVIVLIMVLGYLIYVNLLAEG